MGQFTCDTCSRSFFTKQELATHVKGSHSRLKQPLSCNRCEASFTDRYTYREHLKEEHGRGRGGGGGGGQEKLTCDVVSDVSSESSPRTPMFYLPHLLQCDFKTPSKRALASHLLTHDTKRRKSKRVRIKSKR